MRTFSWFLALSLSLSLNGWATEGELEVSPSTKIAYQAHDKDCGPRRVVIVPGWSESYLHYGEILEEFQKRKICTYIFDLPEQGLSSRSLPDTRVSHLEHFDTYVDALEAFINKVVVPKPAEKLGLLSHSTGGAITLHYLHRAGANSPIDRVVLSSPLIGLNTGWIPQSVANASVWVMRKLGMGKSKVFTQGKWSKEANPFKGNRVTSSEERYRQFISVYEKEPRTRIEGISNSWAAAAFEATSQVPLFMQGLYTPILLLQAENDGFVSNSAQDEFCRMAPHCKKLAFPQAQHGLLLEKDEIRTPVLKATLDWLQPQ